MCDGCDDRQRQLDDALVTPGGILARSILWAKERLLSYGAGWGSFDHCRSSVEMIKRAVGSQGQWQHIHKQRNVIPCNTEGISSAVRCNGDPGMRHLTLERNLSEMNGKEGLGLWMRIKMENARRTTTGSVRCL